MADLWIALLLLTIATFLAAVLGVQVGKRGISALGSALILCFVLTAAIMLPGRLEWTQLFPSSAVVIWSRSATLCLAFVAGIVFGRQDLSRYQRFCYGSGLFLTTLMYAAWPLGRTWLAPVEIGHELRWQDHTCLQSTEVTCAPSAAVTLLHRYGVITDEREMMHVCLTSAQGTEGLGLYRGLTRVGKRAGLRAVAITGNVAEVIQQRPWPAIALIRFPGSNDPRSLFNGQREGHAVVVFGETADGQFEIGDPAFGRDRWTREQLVSRWSEGAIRLASISK